jgi:hypothetical protein
VGDIDDARFAKNSLIVSLLAGKFHWFDHGPVFTPRSSTRTGRFPARASIRAVNF